MWSNIVAIFSIFADICLLKKGPQDVPYSHALFVVLLVIYLLSTTIIVTWLYLPATAGITVALTRAVLTLIFSYALLQIMRLTSRWPQTITAIFGASSIINMLKLPLYYMAHGSFFQVVVASLFMSVAIWFELVAVFLLMSVAIWNLVVVAHIFRHALNVSMWISLPITIGYHLIISNFISLILPADI